MHEYKNFPKDEKVYAFPLIMGSNNTATKVEVTKERANLTVIDVDGKIVDEMEF